MIKGFKYLLFAFLLIAFYAISGCGVKSHNDQNVYSINSAPKTSVRITYPTDTVNLKDEITLNATATYLLKSDVKANATGYITKNNIRLADYVNRGQILFELQTKEARALGNTINELDSSFRFSGNTSVISPASGYVAMLNHQAGDYVQDGEILATITDADSFGFVMEVPYEYNQLVRNGCILIVHLPDGRNLKGYVAKIMPSVTPATQTQKILVKVKNDRNIPENLIATINLVKNSIIGICLPKAAVLTNDSQSEYWVMKLINDTVAVKTDIKKGIENNDFVQIISGNITLEDRIIISGNYGMKDTASVKIEKFKQ